MTDQTEKLKALALAATKGPWQRSERLTGPFWHISSDHTIGGEPCKSGRQAIAAVHAESKRGATAYAAMFEANANFIAAANPAAVLELIADNERLKIENANLQHAFTLATAPDSHVIPPPRGTGSQQEASFVPCFVCDGAGYRERHAGAGNYLCGQCQGSGVMPAIGAAHEQSEATRCRAEGGITSENSGLLDDSKTAGTRMGSSFEGGHLGSAPAAGTDKDAERYRWLRDGSWTNHTHPEIREHLMTCVNRMALDATIDAAIVAGAHTKAGKPA